jgi:hypothetical protein
MAFINQFIILGRKGFDEADSNSMKVLRSLEVGENLAA